MATNSRQQQLMNLVQPGQNQALLQQQKATQQLQMQQALGGANQQQSFRRTPQAQQIGAQAQSLFGQAQQKVAQDQLQKEGQVAGALQQEQSFDIQQGLQKRQQAAKTRLNSITNQISSLNRELKQDIFDNQVAFQKDELGRVYWNERQLADWKLKEAKSDEELADFEQNISQEFEKKMALLRTAQASIRQRLEQEATKSEQEKDQALEQRLLAAEKELAMKMQKAQARAQRNAMIMQAGGTILGAGIAATAIVASGGLAGLAAPMAPAIIAGAGAAGGATGTIGAAKGAKPT
jgi:hypothetical protein